MAAPSQGYEGYGPGAYSYGQAPGPAPETSFNAPSGAPAGSVTHGRASYYADSLAGNSTASGEPYDPTALTAAHRTLPFGTLIEVTRRDTGQSVIVRINDRGPFGKRARILDVSRRAAQHLDMMKAGVVDVSMRILPKQK